MICVLMSKIASGPPKIILVTFAIIISKHMQHPSKNKYKFVHNFARRWRYYLIRHLVGIDYLNGNISS